MTYEEVKAAIEGLVKDPDNAAENAVGLLDNVKVDYESLSSMVEKSAADAERIKKLQDTNQRLFLSVTGDSKEEVETVPDPGIDWDKILTEEVIHG